MYLGKTYTSHTLTSLIYSKIMSIGPSANRYLPGYIVAGIVSKSLIAGSLDKKYHLNL